MARPKRAAALHFTHVDLRNWRNFTSVNVALSRRIFLIGPNASGKSNLLDVFRFLRDLVSVGGGLQEAVQRRGGVSSLRSLAARWYSDIAIRTQIGHDGEPATWKYELTFALNAAVQDVRGPPRSSGPHSR
jgi:predicted ATPase